MESVAWTILHLWQVAATDVEMSCTMGTVKSPRNRYAHQITKNPSIESFLKYPTPSYFIINWGLRNSAKFLLITGINVICTHPAGGTKWWRVSFDIENDNKDITSNYSRYPYSYNVDVIHYFWIEISNKWEEQLGARSIPVFQKRKYPSLEDNKWIDQ